MKPEKIQKLIAKDGTSKYVIKLDDGSLLECSCLYLPYRTNKQVFCLSSQIGCIADCKFCENSAFSFRRNLSEDELFSQVVIMKREVEIKKGEYFDISFMGIGEPLFNLRSILNTTNKLVEKEKRLGRVNISSIGIPPKIKELGDILEIEKYNVHLQISLNASNDDLRKELMPIAASISAIEQIFVALEFYQEVTNDRCCINYILLDGINDSVENANELAKLIKGRNLYVKLTNLNETKVSNKNGLRKSGKKKCLIFYKELKEKGLEVKMFHGNGLDVHASCGQTILGYTESRNRKDEVGRFPIFLTNVWSMVNE